MRTRRASRRDTRERGSLVATGSAAVVPDTTVDYDGDGSSYPVVTTAALQPADGATVIETKTVTVGS